MTEVLDHLRQALLQTCPLATVDLLLDAHVVRLNKHGDTERLRGHLDHLVPLQSQWHFKQGRLVAGRGFQAQAAAHEHLGGLIPWRKGPLRLGGIDVDTEWRSDWKWNRVAPHIELNGCRILDVGAGNGYFGWCMLKHGAVQVIGCDPTERYVLQHELISRCAGRSENHLLALRLEDLPSDLADFDVVFSMGVLYHRRQPIQHLSQLLAKLKPGGRLVLETLAGPGDGKQLLPTPQRYAGMRNVHGLPSLALTGEWLEEAGFTDPECVDCTPTSTAEQRQTPWMPYHSLAQALDPTRPELTVEGLPAPIRAVWLARRPSHGIN